jgi:hypothetical protein
MVGRLGMSASVLAEGVTCHLTTSLPRGPMGGPRSGGLWPVVSRSRERICGARRLARGLPSAASPRGEPRGRIRRVDTTHEPLLGHSPVAREIYSRRSSTPTVEYVSWRTDHHSSCGYDPVGQTFSVQPLRPRRPRRTRASGPGPSSTTPGIDARHQPNRMGTAMGTAKRLGRSSH